MQKTFNIVLSATEIVVLEGLLARMTGTVSPVEGTEIRICVMKQGAVLAGTIAESTRGCPHLASEDKFPAYC